MPLIGTLSTMPLTDLLQWAASAHLTGTLQVERDKVSKSIVFDGGQIIGCSSDDPPERLGQFLIAGGRISEELLRQALTIQESAGRHLGVILVEMGALSPDELSSHLEAKAEETIFSLFGWDDAVFRLQQGARDEANVFPVSLRVEDVLLRGVKRFDEIQRIRAVLHDSRIVLRRTAKTPPAPLLERPNARALLEAVDGDRTVAEICLHVHGSEFVVTRFLFELHQSGLVEIAGIKKIEPLAPSPHAAPQPPRPVAAVPCEPAPRSDAAGPAPTPELPDFTDLEPPDRSPQPVAPSAAPAGPAVAVELEPIERSEAHRLTRQLERAGQHMRQGEFEAALVILDAAYREHPGDEALRRLSAEAEAAFVDKAYRYFLPQGKVPRLTRPVEELATTGLSPTEFFLLSRIDGQWDVKSIVQIAPLREVETLRTLKRMREAGVIELLESPKG